MKSLYVLDALNFLFRSYFAIGPMTNPKGESTNALYGFIRSVFKIIKEYAPKHLVVVFDGPDNTKSRKEIFSDYKIHRAGMPEDLIPQMEMAIEFCKMSGIPLLVIPGVEADDVMGSIAKWTESEKIETYLCSSDKDLCQLVTDHVFVVNIHKDNLILDKKKVKEKFGVHPYQIIDLLAMMGDASDNIPGIEGIGPKTAATLLEEFDSLDEILAHPEKLSGKKRETFIHNKETAIMSKQLATIHLDVKVPKDPDFFRLKEPDLEKVKDFYQEMHFMTLLKELQVPEKKSQQLARDEKDLSYLLINDKQELLKLIEQLKEKKELCIDTETSSVDPLNAKLVGIGITDAPRRGWYIPLNGNIDRSFVIDAFRPLLENPLTKFIGHNLKYDLHVLEGENINVPKAGFDTIIASYVLSPQKNRHSLDTLCLEYFGKVKTPISDLIGKGKNQLTMEEVPIEKAANYCCEDVDYTFRLKEVLEKEMTDENLVKLFQNIELPLIKVLLDMESTGIYVDESFLKTMSIDLEAKIKDLSDYIFDFTKQTFNLNSPKQLGVVLFEDLGIRPAKKTATGYSTSADILESLKEVSPVIPKILEFRSLEKLRSTYVDALPTQINPKTHRIHCTFNQALTATGRLSCQNPNLQNIPVRTDIGRKIRHAFKPEKQEYSFLSADYSQIELRLLAHFSEDLRLIKAFQEGEDIHAYTASLVYGIPQTQVTKQMRYNAKAVNFGILYGQGPFGLSKEIGSSIDEAKTFINTYFERYPKVMDYLESCKESARRTGQSETLLGRIRPIPEINSKNSFIKTAAERLAVNTPLQGTAADLIKMAMLNIDKMLKENPQFGHMILQIHDELIFESPDEHIESLGKEVKRLMENVLQLKIPLCVDISVGKNWGEC